MNKIKAYLLLLTIALSAFAAACSSDDNDPVTPEITISENILANEFFQSRRYKHTLCEIECDVGSYQ